MRKFAVLATAAALFIAAGCGSSGSGGGGTEAPTLTTIDSLPNATGPMASASASVSRNLTKTATTGLNFVDTTSGDFGSSSSMGACQTFNNVREAIFSASQADMILCYVKNMQDAFGTGTGVDVYDGAWHIFNMDIRDCTTDADCSSMGEGLTCTADGKCASGGVVVGSPSRVKMQIVKDAAGSITSFEMFMCGADMTTQQEYTRQTVTGNALEMRAIGHYTGGNGSGSHAVDVAGTLNAAAQYTAKTITLRNTGSWGGAGNANWQEGTLVQEPGEFTFYGYNSGSYTDNSGSGTYTDRGYGTGEMLNDTSADIRTLAMGDGAVKYETSGTCSTCGGQNFLETGVDAWLGDGASPLSPATSSAFYNAANDGTLPTAEATQISFTFGPGETWDCSDDVGVGIVDLPEINNAVMNAACVQFGSMQHGWINCYENITQGGGGGGGGPDFSGTYSWDPDNDCNDVLSDPVVLASAGDNVYEETQDGNVTVRITLTGEGTCTFWAQGTTADACTFTGDGSASTAFSVTWNYVPCTAILVK